VLLHSLGRLQRRRFGFIEVSVTHHSALRRYYMTRNRVILWRRFRRRHTGWVVRDMRRFVSETLFMLVYEHGKAEKLQMLLRGLLDGWSGIGGAFDSHRP